MAVNNDDIRQRNKDAAQRGAFFWIDLANQRQSAITNHLISLAAVLIPLSASIILTNIKLNQTLKLLLAQSWVLMIISILAGLVQTFIDSQYFVFLSRDSSTREALWSNSNKDIGEITKNIDKLGTVPPSSSSWALIVQEVTFIISLIFIVVIGVVLLYTPK